MTQQLLPLAIPAQPRLRRRRPRRSALPGWRFALEIGYVTGSWVTRQRARTGAGLASLMVQYDAGNKACRVVASRDQGRTWTPATADQLRALQADARCARQPAHA